MKKFAWGLLLLLAFMSCDPKGTWQRNNLDYLLNEDNGPMLTTQQLKDSIAKLNQIEDFHIPLPTDGAADVLPRFDCPYINQKTGDTIIFHFDEQRDSILTIGTVEFRLKPSATDSLGDKRITRHHVHSRGEGLYTLYDYWTPEDSTLPQRFWKPILLRIYLGSDSILGTTGCTEFDLLYKIGN